MIGRLLRPLRADPARSPLNRPGLQAQESIRITSPSFADGAPMPARHAGRGVGDDVSPELRWTGVPGSAMQLVLILDDIDVPLRTPLIHSIAILSPDTQGLAAGDFTSERVRIIPTMLAKRGYSGPRPIPGHGPHRYRFHLLALGLSIPAGIDSPKQLFHAAAGHVIAYGTLTGSYER
jgi:phosphatidylethanolamine-binding protein (PEBP) family uncharacterized protein